MLIRGDARALPLKSGCVDCVVTSPPYFGLRNYGDERQIGQEGSVDAFVVALVAVFREVRRVLKASGVVWLNLGDSYAGGGGFFPDAPANRKRAAGAGWGRMNAFSGAQSEQRRRARPAEVPEGVKAKDLIGVPWRVALALQADGWFLRSEVIWSKPNPMPEKVFDRPTRSHEHLFLLSQAAQYIYDFAAIAEPSATEPGVRRNRRSVWTVPTKPFKGAHFAVMPEALVEPCILSGCPVGGLVLDPFCGSGTVGVVASRVGRRWVGVDLAYQEISSKRTRAGPGWLFGGVGIDGVDDLVEVDAGEPCRDAAGVGGASGVSCGDAIED